MPELLDDLGIAIVSINEHLPLRGRPGAENTRCVDRMLLAQCQIEGLRLVTADRALMFLIRRLSNLSRYPPATSKTGRASNANDQDCTSQPADPYTRMPAKMTAGSRTGARLRPTALVVVSDGSGHDYDGRSFVL